MEGYFTFQWGVCFLNGGGGFIFKWGVGAPLGGIGFEGGGFSKKIVGWWAPPPLWETLLNMLRRIVIIQLQKNFMLLSGADLELI